MRGNAVSLRAATRALDEATKCGACGKSRLRSAVAWHGRGTGRRGASHYAATAFEPFDPAKHCACSPTPPNTGEGPCQS